MFVREWIARRDWLWLVPVLLVGLSLRLWGIPFGLPYLYHPDEGVPVSIALRILRTGDFNPGFFHWPSLLFYFNALVYLIYFWLGNLAGVFATPADLPFPDVEAMAVGEIARPEIFLLGRGLSAVIGTLSIIWVYWIAYRVSSNRVVAWVAALFMAVEPLGIKHSQFIRPDTYAIFFALWTTYFAIRIASDPRLRNYVLAGIGVGLTAASKYNVVLVFVTVLVAHILRFGMRGFVRKEIYVAGLVGVLAFLVTTPYAWLDLPQFLRIGPLDASKIYATGHPGAEGNTLLFYPQFLWQTQGWVLLLALAGILLAFWNRKAEALVALCFPLIYYVFINFYIVHFDTTILPVVPYLIIFSAWFLWYIINQISRLLQVSPVIQNAVLFGLVIGMAWFPLRTAMANNTRLLQPDGREAARQWIDANLPHGTRIALESYSPYLDRNKFVIEGLFGIQDHPAEWYVANGFEYLVFSQGVYARYFADPARYEQEVSRYTELFNRFPQIARFNDNGYEIRVHKTHATLPPHRTAIRFGDYGELIELVGYEDDRWKVGEPVRVKLTWRTLGENPEPFEIELRLLDKEDRQVVLVRDDLFQGRGWRPGMFEGEWIVPASKDLPPGSYRLQVSVIWTKFEYRLPAQTWTGASISPVLLGPFEPE